MYFYVPKVRFWVAAIVVRARTCWRDRRRWRRKGRKGRGRNDGKKARGKGSSSVDGGGHGGGGMSPGTTEEGRFGSVQGARFGSTGYGHSHDA